MQSFSLQNLYLWKELTRRNERHFFSSKSCTSIHILTSLTKSAVRCYLQSPVLDLWAVCDLRCCNGIVSLGLSKHQQLHRPPIWVAHYHLAYGFFFSFGAFFFSKGRFGSSHFVSLKLEINANIKSLSVDWFPRTLICECNFYNSL